jgi:GTP-binding protein HflX
MPNNRDDLIFLKNMYPKAIAISGLTGEGLDDLTDAVIEALTMDFVDAEVTCPQSQGKVLSYLNTHADIYRQEFKEDQVLMLLRLPRHLLYHIAGEGVVVKEVEARKPVSAPQPEVETNEILP